MRSERAVFNREEWLINNIISKAIDAEDNTVVDIRMNNVFDKTVALPPTYTTIAKRIGSFKSGDYFFTWDYRKQSDILSTDNKDAIGKILGHDALFFPVGTCDKGIVIMDIDNNLSLFDTTVSPKTITPIGTIETILGLDPSRVPVEVAEVGIFGKEIPVGFILGHHIGLGNLLKTLGCQYELVPVGTHRAIGADEYSVRFQDNILVLKRSDRMASLLIAGFNRYHREIKHYSFYEFDKRDVYGNVLDENGLSARYIREFDLIFKLWIDPITQSLLTEMNEPTDMFNLFISATKKLLLDAHPDEMDMAYMRDKGYERFAGLLYFELIKAARGYAIKPANANASLDLNPEAVWMSILQDQTVMPTEESNPIHSLKEKEVVIFSGSGGRTGRSMTANSRIFHENCVGVVSEATVDSGDVGTITYLTSDPNYDSLRGTSRRIRETKGKGAKLVSTSMMLAPGADMDSPQRVNFISVQNSQTTYCHDYTPLPCRTGYERVIDHRSDPMFAKTADMDGTVESVDAKVIKVKYKDGSVVSYEIGTVIGTWAGHSIPHVIKTSLKKGQAFKKGDVISINTNYFEMDKADPKQAVLKMGLLARIAFVEADDTLEDSSAISERLAERLKTGSVHIRTIRVDFDQEVRNLLEVGEEVEADSILCTIHSATDASGEIFDDESLKTLSLIDTPTPKAKSAGVIEKIEVVYTGELEDMSKSLRHLAESSDKRLRDFNKAMGGKAIDGRVDVGHRIDSKQMELDQACIRVHINSDVDMNGGDKIVFANQMKSVSCRIMHGVHETADGEEFDGFFSMDGNFRRIVESSILVGTTSSLSVHLGRMMVDAYEGN